MAIYKRKNSKYYWFKFYFDGELVQQSSKCTNKKDATTVESAYRTQLALGKVGIKAKKKVPTIKQACDGFLQMVKVEHPNKAETIKRYARNLQVIRNFFGDNKTVDKITPETVEKFKIHRSINKSKTTGRLLKPNTVNHELLTLRMVLNRLVDFDILSRNPARKVKLLDVVKESVKILNQKEQRKYLMACGQPLQDIAVLMIELGMRPGEILNLKHSDIYFAENYLDIREGKTKNAPRKLPLSKASRKVLECRVKSESGKSDYLFPNTKVVNLCYWHQKALRAVGIEKFGKDYFTLYKLRHCFASRHTENKTDMITLSELLGHGDLKTLKTYAHPSFEHKVSAIEKVEKSNAKAI